MVFKWELYVWPVRDHLVTQPSSWIIYSFIWLFIEYFRLLLSTDPEEIPWQKPQLIFVASPICPLFRYILIYIFRFIFWFALFCTYHGESVFSLMWKMVWMGLDNPKIPFKTYIMTIYLMKWTYIMICSLQIDTSDSRWQLPWILYSIKKKSQQIGPNKVGRKLKAIFSWHLVLFL